MWGFRKRVRDAYASKQTVPKESVSAQPQDAPDARAQKRDANPILGPAPSRWPGRVARRRAPMVYPPPGPRSRGKSF
jgi:hypothetical protein